jgi:hypothetical protein
MFMRRKPAQANLVFFEEEVGVERGREPTL